MQLFPDNYDQRLSFVLFLQQKQHLHVRHRSALIQVCFFESTGLFSSYHCIRIRMIRMIIHGRVIEFKEDF